MARADCCGTHAGAAAHSALEETGSAVRIAHTPAAAAAMVHTGVVVSSIVVYTDIVVHTGPLVYTGGLLCAITVVHTVAIVYTGKGGPKDGDRALGQK